MVGDIVGTVPDFFVDRLKLLKKAKLPFKAIGLLSETVILLYDSLKRGWHGQGRGGTFTKSY
jgi:hypothetical protein